MRLGLIASLVVWLFPCHLAAARGDFDEVIDTPMYQDPDLPVRPVVTVFTEKTKVLWLKALERPEADLKCKAADAVALAHRRGVKGLETTVDPLRAVLDQADAHPAVRLAVARTLIALEARGTAPSLLRQAQSGGGDLRELVEPALARWDYAPARAVWLARVRDPATPSQDLVLAVQALAAVGDGQAADRLREIALSDRVAGPVRLEAARALGSLRSDGLEKDAERLAADASPRGVLTRLAAASLLLKHQSAEAVTLLRRLAEDPEPAVAAVAVARLLEVDPDLVVPLVEGLLGSTDPKLRSLAVETLRRRPTGKHIRLLADRLDDAHPEVRLRACRSLEEIAGKEGLRDPVIAEATRILAGRSWQGLEQAAVLLARLDHKPAGGRLLELLGSDRPEVCLTAAWGLRRLAAPDTLPGVVRYVEGVLKRSPDPEGPLSEVLDHQLSQLNQLLGRQKYGPADAVLRQSIPRREKPMRPVAWPESRAAAVWALGLVHEGKTADGLAAALEQRLNDTRRIPPEDARVRRMSAVTLGRLRAKEALASLRANCPDQEPSTDPVVTACGWAVERITGEALHPPKPVPKEWGDWFLKPQD
jgi:HEAT repeat protein